MKRGRVTDEEKDKAAIFMLDTAQQMGPSVRLAARLLADRMRGKPTLKKAKWPASSDDKPKPPPVSET